MKHLTLKQCAAAACLLMWIASPVRAALVSYQFAGSFTAASDPLGSFGITSGDTFSGSFTYDTTLGILSAGAGNVVYGQPTPIAPLSFSVSVNSVQYLAGNSAPLQLQVTNDAGGLHDQFVFLTGLGSLIHPLSASFPVSSMALSLRDTSDTVFSGTAIPATLNLNDFDDNSFSMTFMEGFGPGNDAMFLGTITSLTPVPEPSGLLLATMAMLLLGTRPLRRLLTS